MYAAGPPRLAYKLPDQGIRLPVHMLSVRRSQSPDVLEEAIMAQHRSQKVGEYDREPDRPTRTSRTSSVGAVLVVLVLLIILALIVF
jgi:hypothetical protein